MRRIWQKGMIALARSKGVKSFMQNNRSATALATRYVGGDTVIEALGSAERLAADGIASSFFYLGEYVDTEELVNQNVNALFSIIGSLASHRLDGHVSVDPTQVGCTIDWEMGAENARRLGKALTSAVEDRVGVHCMMLDMEDESVVQSTIDLHDEINAKDQFVALTLQAYLKRTKADIRRQIKAGSKVRLVKGAFVGEPDIAFVGHRAVKENYLRLMELMLSREALEAGFYPIFATHDHHFHARAIQLARQNGWSKGTYEFEMLYGARDDVARDLAAHGERIRLYLPFGHDWWPYAIRRIGENPKNVALLARSLF
jgi:proline dehydrogenase